MKLFLSRDLSYLVSQDHEIAAKRIEALRKQQRAEEKINGKLKQQAADHGILLTSAIDMMGF